MAKRRVIKLDEQGNEVVNEDGTFEFEELDLDEKEPVETQEPEPNKDNQETENLKKEVSNLKDMIEKLKNGYDPIVKVEKPPVYEDDVKSSLGFSTASLKRRN